jgi:hypothetical protein
MQLFWGEAQAFDPIAFLQSPVLNLYPIDTMTLLS